MVSMYAISLFSTMWNSSTSSSNLCLSLEPSPISKILWTGRLMMQWWVLPQEGGLACKHKAYNASNVTFLAILCMRIQTADSFVKGLHGILEFAETVTPKFKVRQYPGLHKAADPTSILIAPFISPPTPLSCCLNTGPIRGLSGGQ